MHQRTPQSLSWSAVLGALRSSVGESVHIRDGKLTAPAASVRNRPSAKGTELCLFPGEFAATRLGLIAQLETLAKRTGRRFATSARVRIGDSHLLIESVADEDIGGVTVTMIKTRRRKLGYNQSLQTGDSTALRSKRIKNG
jgi:hypothetical protein